MDKAQVMNAQDRKWQAESDAGTLAEAVVINNTPVRLKAAKSMAKTMAAEQNARAKALSKVAGRPVTRKVVKKPAKGR